MKSLKFTDVRDMTYNQLICRREACRDEIAETKDKLRGCEACQRVLAKKTKLYKEIDKLQDAIRHMKEKMRKK